MDTGEDAMTKLTDATGNLKWAMREMAAEMLMASSALSKTSSGLDKVSDAAEDGRDGMSAISEYPRYQGYDPEIPYNEGLHGSA